MSEWIDVKDKPPEGKSVLVWSPHWSGEPFVGFYLFGRWHGDRILSEPYGVTHWMPLPEPPKAQL